MTNPCSIGRIESRQTHPLRQRILRPGLPVAEAIFDGDDDAETVHFAATDQEKTVGVVSLYRRPMTGEPRETDWQFRGMAVDAARQRGGVGRRLLLACVDHVRACGGRRLWCNARLDAAGFYERVGFARRGEVFEIVSAGPHVVMRVEVDSSD